MTIDAQLLATSPLPFYPEGRKKADAVHYELLTMATDVYRQNSAMSAPIAQRTRETALSAVETARRAARAANDSALHAKCDEAARLIGGNQ